MGAPPGQTPILDSPGYRGTVTAFQIEHDGANCFRASLRPRIRYLPVSP